MDAGIVAQPVTGVAVTDVARPAAVAGQGAAPTDVPQAKAVNPLPEATLPHIEPQPGNAGAAYLAHNFVIDPQTREVVYRVMDLRTRQVLWQVPDALLRRNAYAQKLADNAKNIPTKNQTDITG